MSDSHDNIRNLENAVELANHRRCSHLIHLGDIVSPMTAQTLSVFNGEITAVFGNCDGDILELRRILNNLGGSINKPPYKISLSGSSCILMHEPYLLEEVIMSGEPDFIFFGHTHEPYFRREGKTVIINPGEIAGIMRKPTFYILDIPRENFEQIDLY